MAGVDVSDLHAAATHEVAYQTFVLFNRGALSPGRRVISLFYQPNCLSGGSCAPYEESAVLYPRRGVSVLGGGWVVMGQVAGEGEPASLFRHRVGDAKLRVFQGQGGARLS